MARCADVGRNGLAVIVLVLVTACGGGQNTVALTPTSPVAPVTTATTRSTTTSSSVAHAAVVELSEGDNGRSVTVKLGDSVTVVLHNTYWSTPSPSNPAVLEPHGSPTVVPQLHGCVPGQGCGTVTIHYLAISAGQSRLLAHRVTCGEAIACAPDQQNWQTTVTVT